MSKRDLSEIADITEPFLDESTRRLVEQFAGEALPDLAADIPVIRTFLTVGKIFNGAKDYHRTKMLLAFLEGLRRGERTIEEFNKMSEQDQAQLRGLVVAQLDMQSDLRQAEAIGFAVDAHLNHRIDMSTLIGVLAEIRTNNPLIFYYRTTDLAPRGSSNPLELDTKNPNDYISAHQAVVMAFANEVYRPICDKYNL